MTTNLALDPVLIEEALKVSGVRTKKAAVTLALKEFVARRWADKNRASIAAFNAEIEERGVWSEGLRRW